MAKFSFHCQCYKAGQLGGIDKHNRRLNKNYISNPDIDTERSGQNRIYIAPKQSLYKDCKEQIEKRVVASGGRITKASNWICEAVFSYPEELPLERLDEYNDLIDVMLEAQVRIGLVPFYDMRWQNYHLHLDILMITEDNRLSAKTLITRDFITSMHRIMPIILKKHGFNIDEYEETEEKKQGGLSAKEYNELADRYNKLIDDKAELERKNREKAYEVMCQQERSR